MNAPVTLYREIDALGGQGTSEWSKGYNEAIEDVLIILARRGYSEAEDAETASNIALAGLFGAVEETAAFLDEEGWPRTAFGLRASATTAGSKFAKIGGAS